jgi:FdhD protein
MMYRPKMSHAGLAPTHEVLAVDEQGTTRTMQIAGELPLTISVDGYELVTLMTLGTHPEALALGYLRNQRLIESLDEIASVAVDWPNEKVAVTTTHGQGIDNLAEKLARRTITTGCGQGTIFSSMLDRLYDRHLPAPTVQQSTIYALLRNLTTHNQIYRQAGAVHGCALCQGAEILIFVEEVGRHNAADAISGMMWLDRISGADKLFYTTGRLTSEIVMKAVMMGIPVILSRSGITQMGLDLARDLGVMMIARAKGRRFLVYSGAEQLELDEADTERRDRHRKG